MGKNGTGAAPGGNIGRSMKALDRRGEASMVGFPILIVIYLITNFFTVSSSRRAGEFVSFLGGEIPVTSMTGVFASMANIVIILLVVFYKKPGYIMSIIFLIIQFPMIAVSYIVRRSVSGVPGLFANVVTIIAVTLIYFNSKASDKFQRKVSEQAVTDRLTGLPNRFAGSEYVNDMIRKGVRFALVSADISNFKSINYTVGYKAGNEVLCKVASRWTNLSDEEGSTTDFIARQSGDEFLIVISGYKDGEELMKRAVLYKEALEKKMTIEDCDLFITGNFGVAEFPVDAMSNDALLSCAIAARYEVKRANSSDRILKFTADLIQKDRTIELEREIRSALEHDGVYFNLQPQYDMDHNLCGFEALARMKDKDGNNISPADFIPVAEKVGLIDKVDGMVFRKAAMFFGQLVKESGSDLTLSFNVSVRHLMKNGFFDEVMEVIKESGISPSNLEIEITESIMIDSAEKALRCINKVKEMGIRIAIDDFGTGYSSLSYLHRFPADILKVDKSFIDKMNLSESSKDYVASIISIGHIMNFKVIAEGVEEQGQLDTLGSIGCDMVQGFIWGRPMEENDVTALVTGVKS